MVGVGGSGCIWALGGERTRPSGGSIGTRSVQGISTSNLYEYMVCRKYVNNSDSEHVNSTYKVVQFL